MEGDYCIMIYGYARVSSKKQLHGNSLEEQTATLTANGATSITTEQFTGKTTSRPKLQALIDSLQTGDTLMVRQLEAHTLQTIFLLTCSKTYLRKRV